MNIKIEHLALLGAIAYIGILLGWWGTQPAAIQPGVTTTPGVVVTCDSTVTPDIDINAYDIDNPTTAITDTNMSYRKKPNGAWATWTLGTAITGLEFGETYEFYMPLSTDIGNADSVAFCKYIEWTAQCKEADSMKIYCNNDETYDGLTNTSYDADGTASTKEAFAAGDVQTVSIKWKAAKDEYYGHPYLTSYPMLTDNGNHRRTYPNTLCLKLNSTAWKEPQEVYLDTGVEMRRVPAPTISAADGATTHIMYCYEAPVITDRQVEIFMTLEAHGTNAPGMGELTFLYAGNMYINTNTGVLEWGSENNEGAYTAGNGDADEAIILMS